MKRTEFRRSSVLTSVIMRRNQFYQWCKSVSQQALIISTFIFYFSLNKVKKIFTGIIYSRMLIVWVFLTDNLQGLMSNLTNWLHAKQIAGTFDFARLTKRHIFDVSTCSWIRKSVYSNMSTWYKSLTKQLTHCKDTNHWIWYLFCACICFLYLIIKHYPKTKLYFKCSTFS